MSMGDTDSTKTKHANFNWNNQNFDQFKTNRNFVRRFKIDFNLYLTNEDSLNLHIVSFKFMFQRVCYISKILISHVASLLWYVYGR